MHASVRFIVVPITVLCSLLLTGCGKKTSEGEQAPSPRPPTSTVQMIVKARVLFPESIKGLRPDETIAIVARARSTEELVGAAYYSIAPSDTSPTPCWKKPIGCPAIIEIDIMEYLKGGEKVDEVMIGAEIHDDAYRLSKGQTGKWTPLGYFGGRGDAPGKIRIVDSPARAVRIRLDATTLKDTVSFDMR